DPGPAVGNTSGEPPNITPPEWGCAWSPPDENGEEPLRLPTFSPAAQVRVAVTFALFALSAGCNLAVLRAVGGRGSGRRPHIPQGLVTLSGLTAGAGATVRPAGWGWRGAGEPCGMGTERPLSVGSRASAGVITTPTPHAGSVPVGLGCPCFGLQCPPCLGRHKPPSLPSHLSGLQLFLFHTITLQPPHNFTQCTTRGSFPRPWHETLYNMVGFACLFLLPLLIMVCCYARILLEISRRMGSGIFSSQDTSLRCSRNNIPRARLRMLRMSLVIVSSFILCWTPYYLLGLWHWFCPRAMEKRISPALTHILFIFGLFNACLDPITYGLFTIPLRGGWGCPCRHGPLAQPPSPATSSFHCSASSL
ncbi:GNRR2 protein, partial [Dryoscopus gambensis]|nr:GNRR2 protein [Dryoscopus gambensis]